MSAELNDAIAELRCIRCGGTPNKDVMFIPRGSQLRFFYKLCRHCWPPSKEALAEIEARFFAYTGSAA
jgi:hypothetical protein